MSNPYSQTIPSNKPHFFPQFGCFETGSRKLHAFGAHDYTRKMTKQSESTNRSAFVNFRRQIKRNPDQIEDSTMAQVRRGTLPNSLVAGASAEF